MMALAFEGVKPNELVIHGDIAYNFSVFRDEVDIYFHATKTYKETQDIQIARLLNLIGPEGRKIYNSLNFDASATVTTILDVLEAALTPEHNELLAHVEFFKRIQQPGEPFDEWFSHLRNLVSLCGFDNCESKLLRTQIVMGLENKTLQQQLLRANSDLETTLTAIRAFEAGEEYAQDLHAPRSHYSMDEIATVIIDEPVEMDDSLMQQPDQFADTELLMGGKKRRAKRVPCTCPYCAEGGTKTSDNKRMHICHFPDCGKIYSKTSHLRAHLSSHNGIPPFKCNWVHCGRRFTRSDELQRHWRTHTGEKRFQCPECHKTFLRSDHLSKHSRVHEKQRMIEAERQAQEVIWGDNSNPSDAADAADKKIFIQEVEVSTSTQPQLQEESLTGDEKIIKIKKETEHCDLEMTVDCLESTISN